MNDSVGKTSSSLAITEKKPQKIGGCIGIFFQLFDWNKRLAKKKLFSKKLLPAVRSKQSSKKFGGDDKQPKLHLIADENSGGFPNVKKVDHGKKHETRAPSLVAKLMGLDSMPSVQRSKSRKGFSGNGSGRLEKGVSESKKLERKELVLERVDTKNEWRPQKLQKTGLSERKPVAKLGADPLQIKTVLSRSRKHQLPMPCSSVKSPKSSGKNASRLIDVATRILEPGLQKSRGRYAITYSNTSSCHSNYETVTDGRTYSPPKQPYNSCYHIINAAMPPKSQTPCTNCGLTLNQLGSGSATLERPSKPVAPLSRYVDSCRQGYEMNQPRNIISYPGMVDTKVESLVGSGSQLNTLKCSYDPTTGRKPINKEDQVKWQSTSQQCNSQKDLKLKTQMQNQTLQMKDRKPVNSKSSSVPGNRVSSAASAIRGTKSFAPLGQSFSGHARRGVPGKVDDSKYESERKARIRRKDAISSEQKKRPTNFHHGSLGASSDLSRQARTGSEVISEKEARCKAVSLSYRQTESSSIKSGDQRRTGPRIKKGDGVDSFTFSSSVKNMNQRQIEVEDYDIQKNPIFENICEDVQSTSLPQPASMSGDALSTLLEQKLKELNSQGEDDFAKGGNAPKKTTAVILQELICALTTEQHFHDHPVVQSAAELDPCYNQHCLSNTDTPFRFKAQPTSPPTSARHENGDNHRLSPGSVLEASFSIDSSSSSNQDDISIQRNKRVFELANTYNSEQNTWEPDADLLESTISQRLQTSGILNNVTDLLCNINGTETSLEGSKLIHAKHVILDVELMLANEGFPISHFLSTELETLARVIQKSFRYTRAWNQVKGFAFDSVIEYLDSRYTRYSKCGFSIWSRLPLHMDSEVVILETIQEIRKWTKLAGTIPDDLIEWDMSHSLGKWTDFEVEAFESGIELDQLILQTLIDELVIDLCTCP
ncbi:transferase [Lithospermum erythrorhizon]|uniref:Transferase n=1 Tax=Lithospermum erythrorhizon TaxID=34254 RepID=A0AAV3RNH3_LITER